MEIIWSLNRKEYCLEVKWTLCQEGTLFDHMVTTQEGILSGGQMYTLLERVTDWRSRGHYPEGNTVGHMVTTYEGRIHRLLLWSLYRKGYCLRVTWSLQRKGHFIEKDTFCSSYGHYTERDIVWTLYQYSWRSQGLKTEREITWSLQKKGY